MLSDPQFRMGLVGWAGFSNQGMPRPATGRSDGRCLRQRKNGGAKWPADGLEQWAAPGDALVRAWRDFAEPPTETFGGFGGKAKRERSRNGMARRPPFFDVAATLRHRSG